MSLSVAACLFVCCGTLFGDAYYVNSLTGDDANNGLSQEQAWKTLQKAGEVKYTTGDRLFLAKGSVFEDHLRLRAVGTEAYPVIVDAYDAGNGSDALPVIDSRGYEAGIHVSDCKYVEISNLEIMSDGGAAAEPAAEKKRYGVLVTAAWSRECPHIYLRNLYIHDIFATEQVESEGKNPTTSMGRGIEVIVQKDESLIRDVLVENCRIERTGHYGLSLKGRGKDPEFFIQDVRVLNNRFVHTGGSGIQPGRVRGLLVKGNVTDHSGSFVDQRMHGRGSGMWPWTCEDVLIENNRFMHARGRGDSCGIHIDFGCRNVVVQYNLSLDNEGGFVEILGNNHNCAYRYNISINDGSRVKQRNGATQEGKILWFSGYVGQKPRVGPFNSYIYNNTVYVSEKGRSCFSVGRSTDGVLIANNIFYLLGDTLTVIDDQQKKFQDQTAVPQNVVFTNNLYAQRRTIPSDWLIQDSGALVGDPEFKHAGGVEPEDYIPMARDLIQNRGIQIPRLPGDALGLTIGLAPEKDFFGNPVQGRPDLGAIEMEE
ncbi:MAG: right-handed parallel beta-helix repeat-containing protein [Kiritimatiellales bacterium]